LLGAPNQSPHRASQPLGAEAAALLASRVVTSRWAEVLHCLSMLSTSLDITTRQVQYQLSVATRHQASPIEVNGPWPAWKVDRPSSRTAQDEQQRSRWPKQIDGPQITALQASSQ
jgi:hypothetical protein